MTKRGKGKPTPSRHHPARDRDESVPAARPPSHSGARRRVGILAVIAVVAVAVVAAALLLVRRGASRVDLTSLAGDNLLVVTLDTTRADHLGCYGNTGAATPTLDGIARDGVLFERCLTSTAYTLPSHASIFTGLYPPFHGVRINGAHALADVHTTLAERLQARGYRTGAFVGAFVLDGRWGLEQGFDRYDDDFNLRPDQRLDLAGVQRPADQVADAALKWLGEDTSRPFFAWVHFYDAHSPYDPPEPFKTRFAGPLERRYDGEIAFADSQLGRILSWLDEKGLSRRTAVVVVGDHGEGLGSHGESEHGYFVYDATMHVPLLMRLPGVDVHGLRVKAQVRTVDVTPTLLELLGAPAVPEAQGVSLEPLLAARGEAQDLPAYGESVATELQYGWSALYSLSTSSYKYIEAPRSELYDLAADPGELHDVAATLPDVAASMRTEIDTLRTAISKGAPATEEANVDEDTMRMLASLGYVGGTTKPTAPVGERRDPKDMLPVYEAIGVAAQAIYKNDHAAAVEQLERVLHMDPGNPQARFLLAQSYDSLGRREEAKTILDGILKEEPDSIRALIAMAGILSEEGHTDEVVAMCRKALAEDDRNAQAMSLIADAYMAEDDPAAALPLLEKAVEIQPKLTRNRNNLAACLLHLGRLDEAKADLDAILKDHPKFPHASFNLGLLEERRGDAAAAEEAYRRELEHYPDEVKARFNLGLLLLKQGETAAGEAEMRRLVEKAPGQPRPYLLLARSLLRRPDGAGEALALVQQGLAKASAPDDAALAYYLLADIYSRQGRRAELERALEQARAFQARAESKGHAAGSR